MYRFTNIYYYENKIMCNIILHMGSFLRTVINSIKDEKVKRSLLGSTNEEQASVLKWLSFTNSDFISSVANIFRIVTGKVSFNKKALDAAYVALDTQASIFETRLTDYTYLVNEHITLADIFTAAAFTFPFSTVIGAEWRKSHPAIVRWFNTVIESPILKGAYGSFEPIVKPLEWVPPKKEKKEQKPKQEKKKAEAKPKATEEPAAEPKKPKHPLSLLPKATSLDLEEWKRKYSNEDTRPVALPWFWEHYNPEEYSIWKVAYKYNDELTMTFMSNNLVGGFFNRLSGSVKYMFGCLVVYGENNNNGIIGAILIRGQDFKPAFDVAPDWESYSYENLDPVNKPEDKEFVNDMWAWDKPVVINGETREIADGKVLK
ncbi:elongation factor 1-gamma family protein SCDLUD_003107 [Saccharomycodes ludwigii]|uniref:elongation factor 1-gamma family protein n=1 Tax=Saccharomycodes ludwigii TaxID=36035 RepID=UPI001E832ACC|nr:hypothetical protein SCDLUD_003107 [Saccharomycodes ludwigii]KAH3900138.1 hypothetical protein SCDLUD_003107 [Saccharomycodes ludwigii]